MGELYIVPTPIGNLEDITIRAKRVLSEVDIILCEDTRRTIKLLNYLNIKNKLISFNEHNEEKKISNIIDQIDNKSIALVSDAGTPTISDPGSKLVRSLIKNKKKVIPLPGASSLITAYSAAGLNKNDFVFHGFPPRKNQEIKLLLTELNNINKDIIFFESPLRVEKFLQILRSEFKDSNIIIFKEITKLHEEIILWEPDNSLPPLNEVKGEFVIIAERSPDSNNIIHASEEEIKAKLKEFVDFGLSGRDSVKKASKYLGVSQKKIYNIYLKEFVKKD
jgi:16S rRNA (cytidine1402-2'-O)-methyltransferase